MMILDSGLLFGYPVYCVGFMCMRIAQTFEIDFLVSLPR